MGSDVPGPFGGKHVELTRSKGQLDESSRAELS